MQEIVDIELAFKRFDFISKAFIAGLKEEFKNGKNIKRINEIQANSNNDDSLRKQEEH